MAQQTITEEGAFQATQRDQINDNFSELYAAVGGGTGDITTENLTVEGTASVAGAFTAAGGAVFNEGSADVDFRVESNGNANAIFVDAGNDRVGIFTASPAVPLDVTGAIAGSTTITAGTGVVATSGNFTNGTATGTLVLKQGANGKTGTFTANGATPVSVNSTAITANSGIIFTLKTVGGTVGAYPAIQTITASTGFTVACTAGDTSVYNWHVIESAA